MKEKLAEASITGRKQNLKQYAFLNSLTSIIDYVGTQVVGFIVSPFIVNGLGGTFYGIWQMLGQMTGFARMADTRATQVLKWSIANKRETATDEQLRSDVTSALIITALILPVVLVIGGVIIWYSPYITQADESYYSLIRMVCSIMILSLVIHKVFDLFESVLRGMNLGFKRMGVRAGIIAIGGALKVWVITQGYGLLGLSLVEVFIALITGLTFYYIVKKTVGWFGFGKTNKKQVISYGKLSGWFMAFTGSKMFLLSSDKILLGYLIGPLYVTQYTITLFTSYALQGVLSAITNGVIPGIGGLFGKGEFDKVREARNLIFNINWLLLAAVGTAILLFNQSFVSLWIGSENYAGNMENLFILLIAVQFVFFQTDSLIINVSLQLKMKVLFSVLASVVTFLLAFFLVDQFEILGLCWSILAGRLVLSLGYPIILERQMDKGAKGIKWTKSLRPVGIAVLLFYAGTRISEFVFVDAWLELIFYGAIVTVFIGSIFWLAGLRQAERRQIIDAFSKIKLFKNA